ncbi:winged helix-turn-helix domain-containing protein [Actinokineospora sp. NBRC 105648]|uniref:ArsR/SmtB family transcription factor n=1 Tax=Actinokineospora sp. NBRC 105648 TaxID=3032206 RepID=UPI0024A23B67|nr:winged helix-turn-helix domain-containing protein [Actinokineospora sp. NBRC 105648]GLZ43224.1 transcriptional regulator [Actinokineospora sp. NBRC 105648]
MITAHLDAAAMSKVRLGISPAMEALAWLRLTIQGHPHPIFGDPGPSARFALRDPDVRMVAGTLPVGKGYMPDLFTPQPPAVAADRAWQTQLEQVAATDAETVAYQMTAVSNPSRDALDAVEAGTFAKRSADGLARFWTAAIADSWSGLRERLDSDLAERARTMATEGVGALLGTLHTDIRWTGSALQVDKPWDFESHPSGLVLAPAALAWPTLFVQIEEPTDGVVYFPANGLGVPRAVGGPALSRLLGPTRATLLRDLDVPRTTTDLSTRHRLAPATVSYHLSVLHGSGLVAKARDRRAVLYWRTDHGNALR